MTVGARRKHDLGRCNNIKEIRRVKYAVDTPGMEVNCPIKIMNDQYALENRSRITDKLMRRALYFSCSIGVYLEKTLKRNIPKEI